MDSPAFCMSSPNPWAVWHPVKTTCPTIAINRQRAVRFNVFIFPFLVRLGAHYNRPSKARMMMITSRSPTIPPGPYPQPLLYPQVGNTPISASINRMTNIVPRLITSSFFGPDLARFTVKRIDRSYPDRLAEHCCEPWGFAPERLEKSMKRVWGDSDSLREGCARPGRSEPRPRGSDERSSTARFANQRCFR